MKTKYLAFAAAAFMLASCSNDEDFVPQDNLKDTLITVTAGVEGMLTRAGYETNTDNDDLSILPETFYLTITQDIEDATSKYNYTNVLMTKTEGENKYTSTTNLLWKDNDRDVAVNAYTTDATTFTVQTDQSTTDGVLASDLLGAVSTTEGDVTISGDNISVRFRHLLCKLDVIYSWGTEFDNATKSIKNVVYNGFGTDVTLDRATATITSGSSTDIITTFVGKTTVGEEEKDMSEAIFAPQTGNPKIVITAQIDGVERIFSLNVTAPTGGFVSGNRYTMNVAIGGTATQTGEMNISKGWETGDANGEADGTTGNMATN
ncbi:MAG: fimbrillin family protein [Bacteroidaceae bacterium]|nr:fimbrillin family protein [Bacteroidaceae bacterium]